MPRTKSGEKITWKEFFARWKKGIEGITQLQMTKQQLRGMKIILLGLLCGIIVCLFNIKNLWWLLIILVGGFYVNIVQYIGTWQKKKILQRFEVVKEIVKEKVEEDPEYIKSKNDFHKIINREGGMEQ